jgi:Lecithin retinol acyltransferase
MNSSDTTCIVQSQFEPRRAETPGLDRSIEVPSLSQVSHHRESDLSRAGHRINWVLAEDREPLLGAHLGTPRLGYLHHGIYVGGGFVVHYAGYVHGLHRGPVEETDLARFKAGQSLWVASNPKSIFDRSEVVRRARSRIGERRYRLLTNNCEHFCEWCVNGEPRSYQVEALLAWQRRAMSTPVKVAVQLLSRLGRVHPGLVELSE